MSTQTILLDIADDVAVITLNRPDKLNAFNEDMHKELRAAIKQVKTDKARALVLTGAGRAFCAGADLGARDLASGEKLDLGALLEKYYNPLVLGLRRLPLPVIAAVNGVAAGAGANIALMCDLTFAARSARFIQAFVKIGLVPDAGGTFMLPRLIGLQKAMGLAMTGDDIDAETAESWGLIWKCVEDEALMDTVMDFARHLATQPTRAIGLIKRAMLAAAGNDLESQLRLERNLQRVAGYGTDYREGVAAFMDKRPPKFTGT
ncbi:MAG: 2-(1,2-epoxy-1,2-dihydrophenyl)acetyl-CoA isomerase PaaG [Alphaproteobacteria bacterium]|jgi:2-(1,2-epoxy-1,2-dihydrophenyl)acetyl-CoA isomerase|nr:2-(1,2-epoxy-1,2-dihydrophenyl)acetyl-CoA isomerase PaaG [Alphaproteobacteria bacterium]MDP6517335.1 2-(1,2-epoxy-1,2-dihydrophenyl)acetyl-CoA isomerase PaaG [Alphaproteobacteria bacterium]